MKPQQVIDELVELQAARPDCAVLVVTPDEILVAELSPEEEVVVVSVPIGGSKQKPRARWKQKREPKR